MKVCIPAEAPQLEARLDERLGRAACFVLVDGETGAVLASAPNAQNKQAAQGAGVQAGQTIATLKPDAVLCANCGPKAFRVLQAAGVRVYLGAAGTVAEAVAAFKDGRLAEAAEANVEGHW
jgi:predicted Fe-Mo cluster-binding NifX family protein